MFKYYFEGAVQFDENKKLVVAGISIRYLSVIKIKAWTERRVEKKAFKFFNEQYPQYKDMIQLI